MNTLQSLLLLACASVIGIGLFIHHERSIGVKTEAAKIQTKTATIVKQVQEKDDAIRNIPSTDKRIINRLQHNSY